MDQMTIIILVVMLVAFYVFQMRSNKKKKKQEEEMRNSLTAGDTITTIGGIFGKVVSVSDGSIVFETSEDRVRVEVAKWAISTTGKSTQQEAQK
jgi:preprotein translocase subunit YajC